MTTLSRIKVRLSNFLGAPGVCTFHCLDPATWRPDLLDFWTAVGPLMPTGVVATIEAQGDLVDDATGDITGSWTEGSEVTKTGATGTGYSGASGACVTWNTTAVVNSRRLRGRTFLVPLGGGQYDSLGSLADSFLTTARPAATALCTTSAGQMLVWARPFPPATGATRAGSSSAVVSATIRDQAAILRSRR